MCCVIPRLLRLDVRGANGVEQRRLAMVHVAQHRHHRRALTQFLLLLGGVFTPVHGSGRRHHLGLLRLGSLELLHLEAHVLRHDRCGVIVDELVDIGHNARVHQLFDQVDGAAIHGVGQVPHGDRLG